MIEYNFIKNKSLREKIKETYEYIKFLLNVDKKILNENNILLLNRDIIIHTSSILEWMLTYLLIEINSFWKEESKKIINNFIIKKEYKKVKWLSNIELFRDNKKLFITELKETKWKINWKLNIWILIKLSKKLKIFSKNIEDWLEDIQKIRNDLHLQKILEEDIYKEELSNEKMFELFFFTKKFQIEVVENLNDLK